MFQIDFHGDNMNFCRYNDRRYGMQNKYKFHKIITSPHILLLRSWREVGPALDVMSPEYFSDSSAIR